MSKPVPITIACGEYDRTRPIKEEHGVEPGEIRWRRGGQEEPGRDERPPLELTNGIELLPIPAGETLNGMLVKGTLDAVFSARAMSSYVNAMPNIGLLFPNYPEVERAYFQRTGIFPIMHLVGIKKALVERYPWLPGTVYKAFCAAKRIALSEMREMAATNVMVPWPEVH